MDIVAILIAFVLGLFIERFYKVIIKAIQLAKEDNNRYPSSRKYETGDMYLK